MPGDLTEDQEKIKYISEKISTGLVWSQKGRRLWSLANHGSTMIIVVFSALSAVLAQTTGDMLSVPVKNIATSLSLAVTVISTIQSKLGFERKWIANRMTNSALQQLQVDEKMKQPVEKLAEAYKEIRKKHDLAIVATSS